jgi:hypothetical protein
MLFFRENRRRRAKPHRQNTRRKAKERNRQRGFSP